MRAYVDPANRPDPTEYIDDDAYERWWNRDLEPEKSGWGRDQREVV